MNTSPSISCLLPGRSLRAICCLLFAWLLIAAPSTGRSAVDFLLDIKGIDGESAAAVYDDDTGILTIGRHLERSDPEWKYISIRRYLSHFDGRFLTAADLNNDQLDDLILPGYAANKLLVIWGHTLDQPQIVPETFDVGAGPLAVAIGQRSSSGPAELLIATAGSSQLGLRGWNLVTGTPLTPVTSYQAGFAQEGLPGAKMISGLKASTTPGGIGMLHRDAGSGGLPTLSIFARNPVPSYGPGNSIRRVPFTHAFNELASGYPNGATQPGWFLAFADGLSTIALVPYGVGDSVWIDLGSPVQSVKFLPDVDDEVLVVFANGELRRYDFTPGQGLTLLQQLTPPPGLQFAGAVGSDGELITIASDPNGNSAQFQLWSEGPTGYGLVKTGDWPAAPAAQDNVTVALYTSTPFGGTPPLLIESFAAGNWAAGAQVIGNQINAVVETFGGPAAGLGSPMPQSLQPGIAPGAGSTALGNQWERSSSLYYFGSPVANGLATVAINPPAGNYPNSIQISFQPGVGVTPHYRVNLGAWQTGAGPVWLAQSATVEFYGEHNGGSLSPIQTAAYFIDQQPDADGDGVPDAIELLAGTDLTKADSDGDGDSDFKELIGGSDPNDPASRAGPHVKVFDGRLFSFVWNDALSAVLPADDQDLFFSDPASPGQAPQKGTKIPGLHRVSDVTLKRGILSQQAWFPAGYAVEGIGGFGPAMTALVGIEFPPVPAIPIDLNAADPVAAWLVAAQAALDDFHAKPPEFTVGPASTMGAVIIEYWYGSRLLELGRISSLTQRPRLADSPNSPSVGFMSAADIDALQQPATLLQPGHDIAQVWQLLNTAIQLEPEFEPLRRAAEAAFAQAMLAALTDSPLDPPIDALRRLISGDPVPAGYLFPIVQATAINLRDLMLALVDPRPQVEVTGEIAYNAHDVELETISGRYTLFKPDGKPVRASGSGWLVPGATADVRGFLLPGPPPAGTVGEIEVLEFQITAMPEAGYADLDGNGLPDAWEQIFLGGLGSPLGGDTDGDGYLDPEELFAGTDPSNSLLIPTGPPATPREMRVAFDSNVGPAVEWDGSFGVDYELWSSINLINWQPVPTPVLKSGAQSHTAPIEGNADNEFYRVLIKFPWLQQ